MISVVEIRYVRRSEPRRPIVKHFVGLDVAVKETSVCIVDETGKVVREEKVPSHPEDLSSKLVATGLQFERIGLEAGPLSQWLFDGSADKD